MAALVGVGAAATLAGLLAAAPLAPATAASDAWFAGDTWAILGRAFALTEGIRALFLAIYGAAGLLFLLSIWLPQGHSFVPAGLAVLSPLAGMVMVQPFVFGAPLMLGVVALLVWLIQAGRAGSTHAAWRYFLLMTLVTPLILLAGRLIETSQPGYILAGWRLLSVGLIVWLAGFPFYIWLPPIVEEASPLVVVFLLGVVQVVVVVFAWQILAGEPLFEMAAVTPLLRLSGLATVVTGGLWAFATRSSGRLLGYVLLTDLGVTLLTLSVTDSAALTSLLSGLTLRFVSLTLAAVGLTLARQEAGSGRDWFASAPGLAYSRPLAVALYSLGVLSLAGLPLTPGFGGRWAFIALVSNTPWLAPVVLLAVVSNTAGLLRGLVHWLTPAEPATTQRGGRRWETMLGALLLTAGVYLALFPQTLLDYTYQLVLLFRK